MLTKAMAAYILAYVIVNVLCDKISYENGFSKTFEEMRKMRLISYGVPVIPAILIFVVKIIT